MPNVIIYPLFSFLISGLFNEQHCPKAYIINGDERILCVSCYKVNFLGLPKQEGEGEEKQYQKQEKREKQEKYSNNNSRRSESSTEVYLNHNPIVVTFVSPPLGLTLKCGPENKNALLVRVDRYDNNDNAMTIPTGYAVLKVNDEVMIGKEYLTILAALKRVSFPAVIVFGTLYESMKANLMYLLCTY